MFRSKKYQHFGADRSLLVIAYYLLYMTVSGVRIIQLTPDRSKWGVFTIEGKEHELMGTRRPLDPKTKQVIPAGHLFIDLVVHLFPPFFSATSISRWNIVARVHALFAVGMFCRTCAPWFCEPRSQTGMKIYSRPCPAADFRLSNCSFRLAIFSSSNNDDNRSHACALKVSNSQCETESSRREEGGEGGVPASRYTHIDVSD